MAKSRFHSVEFARNETHEPAGSRAGLISSNNAVVSAFAVTRAVMAIVILATIIFGLGGSSDPLLFLVRFAAVIVSVAALGLSAHSVVRRPQARALYAERPWAFILLDSLLAVGVLAVLDTETSPFAWVALITPVLETAVVFSMASAGFVWLGLSLTFLALRIATNTADDATVDTLVLSLQQVVAVLFVAGPAALMADSAQQRIDRLSAARRTADQTAERLTFVTESAQRMSKAESVDEILGIVSKSALSLGFDQADVVIRDSSGQPMIHSGDSVGPAASVPAEIFMSSLSKKVASIAQGHPNFGDALRLSGVVGGHGVQLSTVSQFSDRDEEVPNAVLRAWRRSGESSPQDIQALELLGAHAREAYRASELLVKAQSHADQLEYEIRHDGLTGLASRAFILESLEERLQTRELLAIFFIDLDGFKALNDTYGHRAGDDALIAVSERLRDGSREGELAGRMGGDEFIVIVPLNQFDGLGTLERYGNDIVCSIGEPIVGTDFSETLGASVGIAVYDGVVGADQLIRLADASMYEAKRAGGGVQVSPASVELFSRRKVS